MARVNVDDASFLDPRLDILAAFVGNRDLALGILVRLWRLGTHYWGDNRSLIPKKLFDPTFIPCIDAGYVEEREGGYYCKGAEERFDWYLKQCIKNKHLGEVKRAAKSQPGSGVGSGVEPVVDPARTPPTPVITPVITIKNTNSPELENSGVRSAKPRVYKFLTEDMALAVAWAVHAEAISPHTKIDLDKWADTFRRIKNAIPTITHMDLELILKFVRNDPFWGANAVSPCGLMNAGSNGLRKIENIIIKMAGQRQQQHEERRPKRNIIL